LKALFKLNDEDLTFTRAIQVAVEIEEAAKVAKERVHRPAILFINCTIKRRCLQV